MNYPRNYQTTSTQNKLNNGPQDMPDRGGGKVNVQTTSSQSNLSRKENPVAALGARPHMGTVQTTSTQAGLSRTASSPYDNINATKPQVSLAGGKKRK